VPALAGALLCAVAIALPAAAERGVDQTVDVSTTGLNAERIKTIPIAKRQGQKPRVVMSLSPDEVGGVQPGDAVWAGAEVEVSVTCLEPMRQCVGKIYRYSPFVRAQLVLADGSDDAGGNTTPISEPKKLQCSQKLPHRNHHCVLALDGLREIKAGTDLPCVRCNVNLVLEAYNPSAKKGHVVVVGTDADNGAIKQDKGMLNAAVFEPGPPPSIAPDVTRGLSTRRLPVAPQFSGSKKKTIVISQRLPDLREDEQLVIDARLKLKTKHLGYGALLQSQMILSEKPGSTSSGGVPAKVATSKGRITALNGFNCTRGQSGHKSPCTVRKLGVVRLLKDARARPGREDPGPFVPLYVNIVMQSKAEFGGHRHRSGDAAKIKGGEIQVDRYGPEYR
jgi:hypothetical protein